MIFGVLIVLRVLPASSIMCVWGGCRNCGTSDYTVLSTSVFNRTPKLSLAPTEIHKLNMLQHRNEKQSFDLKSKVNCCMGGTLSLHTGQVL